MNELKQWKKERNEALESKDVSIFLNFMKKWVDLGVYDKEIYESFKKTSDAFKLGTMAKMIIQCLNISKDTREWAKQILDNLGWSYNIH